MSTTIAPPRASLLQGNPGRLIVRKAFPMLVGILGIVAFELIDTFYIGMLGTTQLAAIGFSFPVVMVVGSIAMGLGVGTSSVISRAIGGADAGEVRFLTTSALFLAVAIVTAVILAGLPLLDTILTALGAAGDVQELARQYMTIWLLGVPFVVIPMVGNNAIRATGNMRTPAVIMLVAAGANAILDPVLIFGLGPIPAMGLRGAAIATVIGRMITLVISLTVIHRRYGMIDTRLREIRTRGMARLIRAWGSFLAVGLPAAATNLVVPVSMGVITRLVSTFGVAAVAGFAVAGRIEIFALAYLQALGAVATPFFGQHSGAAGTDTAAEVVHRMLAATRAAALAGIVWGAAVFAVVLLGRHQVARIFATDPEVIAVTAAYLLIVAGTYPFQGLILFSSAAFNGLNEPLRSAITSITRMVALAIPLALLFRTIWGLPGVFAATAAANVLTGTVALIWLRRRVHLRSR